MHKPITPHFRYFSHAIKKELGELYAATAIADFAIGMILIFEPIYFVAVLHWSLTQVFLFFAAVYFFYVLLIPLGGKFAATYGLEKAMIWNIPFQIGYWLLLFNLPGNPSLVPLAAFVFAVQKSFFWPAFHAMLSRYSDSDQRARESSMIWSLIQVTFIIGPFVGGFISSAWGLRALLVVASLVYLTMFIPLLSSSTLGDKHSYRFKDSISYYKKFPKEAFTYIGFGEELVVLAAWPIFIYTLVPNFFNLGLLIAATTLVASLLMLYAGKIADKGEGRLVLNAGIIGSIVVWLSRPLINSVGTVFAADSLLRMGRNLFYVPITTTIYNRANQEKILAYNIFFEQALSIGKTAASLLGALIFYYTESYGLIFALAAVFTLLYLFLPKAKRLSTVPEAAR